MIYCFCLSSYIIRHLIFYSFIKTELYKRGYGIILKDRYYLDNLKKNCPISYIKFDILGKGNETIYLHYAEFPTRNEIISTNQIGTFILEILNNYNNVIETIDNCQENLTIKTKEYITNCRYLKKKIRNQKSNDYKNKRKELEDNYTDTCINIIFELKTHLMKISTSFVILEEFLTNSVIYYISTYNKMYYDYKERIENLKSKGHTAKIWLKCFNTYKEVALMEEQYSKIFTTLKHDLKIIQGHYKTKTGEKYKRVFQVPLTVKLPSSEVVYSNDFSRLYEPISYTYEITKLEDLLNISLYQLSLQKQFIIRCKNCNKYSISERKDKIFCDRNCKGSFTRKNNRATQDKISRYYSILSNRYRHSKIYEKANIKLKTIYNQYRTKQIDDKTFMAMLCKLDKNVKNTYNVKRGRPKKQ